MGFGLLLQENHVVVTVEVIVFSSFGEESFAGDFDFLLGGDISIDNVVVESGGQSDFNLNYWFPSTKDLNSSYSMKSPFLEAEKNNLKL